ncbi:hypothetical protein ONS95_004363 [Cadophora gregata]|uniref:uncharacterized protein n=1 Tax=Cadophora gregata TaxID=51156 RepID=UPI0026DA9FE0|nr:uncharacterized protein ONS95_004363 [Cadophora gregata]KAK0105849.1 hypothetical protein ONS95_004363 [Cadophora gregata]
MESRTYGLRPHTNRSSFDDSKDRRSSSLTKWPNMSVEDGLQNGRSRSPGVHSTAELFYEAQPPKQQTIRPSQRIKQMFTRFPWRDMSWLVGVTFTVGSAFFIVNGLFLLLPLTNPSTIFDSELYWTGATGVIGGVIFILGGFAGILEALNLNRGAEVTVIEGITVDGDTSDIEMKSDEEAQRQINKLVAPFRDSTMDFPLRQTLPSNHSPSSAAANSKTTTATLPALYGSSTFIFWPNTPQLRTFYFRDLCFIAAIIQSIGTFIFMLAIITAFPGVIDLTNITLFYTANLLPATLGGVLFITASVLQMITTQPNWYTPRPLSVEWHVGFWNVIGSIGFTLAGALFYLGTTAGSIQASGASLWGSCAFIVGGLLQWYVAMKNCR